MAKSSDYTGNVELIDGLIPANNQDFPLVDAHYVLSDGVRLDKRLEGLADEIMKKLPYAEEVSV